MSRHPGRLLHRLGLVGCLLVCPPAAASPVVFVETFDGFGNEGAWTFGPDNELIRTTGGNPTYFPLLARNCKET